MFHLLFELRVEVVLHFSLAVKLVLRHPVVLFWAKVRLRLLLNIFFINLFSQLIHLNLLVEDLADGLSLLAHLHIIGHLESIILILKSLELLLVFNFLLLRSHQVHFEALASVLNDTLLVVGVVHGRSEQNSLMFSCIKWSLLDVLVVEGLLFLVFEINSIDSDLVFKYE